MSDDEKHCYCDSRQCDICTPDVPRGDMVKVAVIAAGVAERALERTQRAEAVVEAARKLLTIPNGSMVRGRAVRTLREALAAYDRAKAAS